MSYVLLIWFFNSINANDTFTISNIESKAACEELAIAIKKARPDGRGMERGHHTCNSYKQAQR